ncbi:MAG: NAD(P)/FAD-dependent oxidoreductase [Thermoleophilia bacterium]
MGRELTANTDSYQRIAVVGAGISGLAAAWLLSSKYTVDIYEANGYLGGHTNTVDVTVAGSDLAVDTGFMVCNYRTYPHFTRMLDHLEVDLQPSLMSFSIQCEDDGLEWAGQNLNSVFAQRRNALNPRFLKMLFDIWRLSGRADRLIDDPAAREISLGELLEREKLGDSFRDWYLVPMGAAIWSVPPVKMMEFPAHAFLRFCDNHGLLRLRDKPQWYTVTGGARTYVERLSRGISGQAHTGSGVAMVRRDGDSVEIFLDGETSGRRYDAAVLACHADESLRLLEQPTASEDAVLRCFPYQQNDAYLHTDSSFLPSCRQAVASWNYRAPAGSERDDLSVTYNLNLLQDLDCPATVMVTLNPPREPDAASVLRRFAYSHPVFSRESGLGQTRIEELQGDANTWYAGAWQRYGFHEDGLMSAIGVARDFGVSPPWGGIDAD